MIAPMLAKIGNKEDLAKKGYIYEPKLDGTRALLFKNKEIKVINRRYKNILYKYPEFKFKINAKSCILDAEIVVYDEKGNPNFSLLQSRDQLSRKFMIDIRSRESPATLVVFDILMKDGKYLTELPLAQRKKILDETIAETDTVEKIFYTTDGKALWKEVTKRKLEGVMAKKADSKYYMGKRTPVWLKIKFLKTAECLIAGYTSKKRAISALALAVYEKGKLKYIGRVGTGFTENFLKELLKELKPLKIKKAPAVYKGSETIQWVKPELICEVRYLELSKDKILRAPAFMRMRTDKMPQDCIIEEVV